MNWNKAEDVKPKDNERVLVYSPTYGVKDANGECVISPIQFGRWNETIQQWNISGTEGAQRVTHWARAKTPRFMGDVKACPFCGKLPEVVMGADDRKVRRIMCTSKKGCVHPDTQWSGAAKKHWNKRAD
jgi:hypothetical protein